MYSDNKQSENPKLKMLEFTDKLDSFLREIRTADFAYAKQLADLEMRILRAERGNETLQDRIREKDGIISDLKDVINTLKGRSQQGDKPKEQQKGKDETTLH